MQRYRPAVVVLSLLLSLTAAELFLRLAAPVTYRAPVQRRQLPWRNFAHRASTIPGLAYELVPNVKVETDKGPVKINRFGMRDGERALRAPPGTVRIAALGDSVTFGFGVTAETAYAAVLERCLNVRASPGRTYEVLNFGVGGYSTRDEATVLAAKVTPFSPERILLGYVLNDPETEPIQPLHAYFTPPSWWQSFHLGRLVAKAAHAIAVKRYGGGDYTRYLHTEPDKWKSVLRGFDRIQRLSQEQGYQVIVAIFPLIPPNRWEAYPYADLHAQVAEAASARGFEVIDLLPALSMVPPPEIRVSADDRHPNVRGHRLAARAICDRTLALEAREQEGVEKLANYRERARQSDSQ